MSSIDTAIEANLAALASGLREAAARAAEAQRLSQSCHRHCGAA
jgi:hypothetical protein